MVEIRQNYCIKCGHELEMLGEFCARCGSKIFKNETTPGAITVATIATKVEETEQPLFFYKGLRWSATVFVLGLFVWGLGIAIGRSFGLIDYFSNVLTYAFALSAISISLYLVTRRKNIFHKQLAIGGVIWGAVCLVATLVLTGAAVTNGLQPKSPSAEPQFGSEQSQNGDQASCKAFFLALKEHQGFPSEDNVALWAAKDVGKMGRWLGYQIEGIDLAILERPSVALEMKLDKLRELFRKSFVGLTEPYLDNFVSSWKRARTFLPKVVSHCKALRN